MALAPFEDYTIAKIRRGFMTRKEANRGPPPQSPIPEASMLRKMAGVLKAPPAGLEEK